MNELQKFVQNKCVSTEQPDCSPAFLRMLNALGNNYGYVVTNQTTDTGYLILLNRKECSYSFLCEYSGSEDFQNQSKKTKKVIAEILGYVE